MQSVERKGQDQTRLDQIRQDQTGLDWIRLNYTRQEEERGCAVPVNGDYRILDCSTLNSNKKGSDDDNV